MKRILIMTFGTRGDVQPYVALAEGLKAAEYEVALCTAESFRADVEAHAIPFLAMGNELLDLSKAIIGEGVEFRQRIALGKRIANAIRRMMDDEWAAAQAFKPDAIIYHCKCLASYHIAEKLNIPAAMSLPLPFYTPTKAFAVPFVAKNLGGWLNRSTYRLIPLTNAMYAGSVNDFRTKALGIPPVGRFANLLKRSGGEDVPVLYPISPSVVPVPNDYPEHVHMTGYWFLNQDSDWSPDADLLDFLNAGEPPVYIGFGSVSAMNATKRTQIVIDAIQSAGIRAILSSGWSELDKTALPKSIFPVGSVPHDWLFPRVAAVVHHGGAGTTAAGLRAGKPTLICPFFGDQPFWGKRVHDLGVGAKPIPQNKVTTNQLAKTLSTLVHDDKMRNRAAELKRQIEGEDGLGRAVSAIRAMLR